MQKYRKFLPAVLLLVMICLVWSAPASKSAPAPTYPQSTVILHSSTGDHTLKVEVATTPQQLGRGLMFREELPEDAGMLFDFGDKEIVTMWMKNTPLPLDMLFIDENGVIQHITENTVPFSLDTISSEAPVSAVIEVNAGTAKRLNLKTGDIVKNQIFNNVP